MTTKMVDIEDSFWILRDWVKTQPHKSPEKLTSKLPRVNRLRAEDILYGRVLPNGQVTVAYARHLIKALRAVLKDVGQYGGDPAKLDAEKDLLKDAIEELTYQIKTA